MSAFRALRQLTAASGSTSRSLLARQLSTSVSRVSARAGIANAARFSTPARAFSVSARRFGEGSTDLALSQKLHEELKYEKENEAEVGVTPEWLKAFQESGVWKIEDAAGNDEIILSRSFGNENLRLIFSIADISSAEENYAAEEEAAEEGQEDDFNMYPIRAALSITKNNGPGCLNVDMVCQEGNFVVENVSFYKDSKLGTELTAEADWKRRGVYIGPQFDTLDVALQDEFEKFLQERGVDEHIANFIPQYAEYKEQKEYMQWLNNVKSFVDQ